MTDASPRRAYDPERAVAARAIRRTGAVEVAAARTTGARGRPTATAGGTPVVQACNACARHVGHVAPFCAYCGRSL